MVPITHCSRREQPVVLLPLDKPFQIVGLLRPAWESFCSVVQNNRHLFVRFIWPAIVIGEKFERARVPLQLIAGGQIPAGRTTRIYDYG